MSEIPVIGVAHFAIPVSDPDKSIEFYTKVVGCRFLSTIPDGSITFLDAGGVCVLLIKRPAPINRAPLEMENGVHHAFMIRAEDYELLKRRLEENDVESFFEEDRRGGVIDGPRFYFRDPDGTALEFIHRTAYRGV